MQQANEKPRVFCAMPSRSGSHLMASASHYALPTRGGVEVIPGIGISSILSNAHNLIWATALNYAKAGIVTHFLCHHSDIEIRTHGWLDLMCAEMERTGAAVLSVVQPIKDGSGKTSTAIETADPWKPKHLTLSDLAELPETFTRPDLLVNTGLLLINVRRSVFHEVDKDRNARFYFQINDRIRLGDDEQFMAHYQPEDWNFSRQCHAAGLPVYVTRKVECVHYGEHGYSNQPPKQMDGWFDFPAVYREAVQRTPPRGRLVEVGCWKGKSLKFLVEEAKREDKGLKIYGVDHFQGSVNQPDMQQEAATNDIYKICFEAVKPVGYCHFKLWQSSSLDAAKRFEDNSLDFVFLDASHDFDSVCADIRAWLPKVKPGGVLAGHDYDPVTDPGVVQAVKVCLPRAEKRGRCWWYELGETNA